jgi:hypothetical protein
MNFGEKYLNKKNEAGGTELEGIEVTIRGPDSPPKTVPGLK